MLSVRGLLLTDTRWRLCASGCAYFVCAGTRCYVELFLAKLNTTFQTCDDFQHTDPLSHTSAIFFCC